MDVGGLRHRWSLSKRLALSVCLGLTSSILPGGATGLPMQFGTRTAAAGSQLASVSSQKQKLNVFNPATLTRPGPRPTSLTTPASGLPAGSLPKPLLHPTSMGMQSGYAD